MKKRKSTVGGSIIAGIIAFAFTVVGSVYYFDNTDNSDNPYTMPNGYEDRSLIEMYVEGYYVCHPYEKGDYDKGDVKFVRKDYVKEHDWEVTVYNAPLPDYMPRKVTSNDITFATFGVYIGNEEHYVSQGFTVCYMPLFYLYKE